MGVKLIFTRKPGRSSFRSAKRYNLSKTHSSFSNNKPRVKGSISNLYVKYIKLAKEASSAGDRIQAEYYNQFADHFSRIMIDDGIKPYENKNISEISDKKDIGNSSLERDQEISKPSNDYNVKSSEKTDIENKIDENENSLETVPFISQPAKKTAKLKK